MSTASSSRIEDKCIHVIKFNAEYEEIFFIIDVNEHGFVKANLLFPEDEDPREILSRVANISYHEIDCSKGAITEITEKIRIKVVFGKYIKQVVLEADDQCWYVRLEENRYTDYRYGEGALKLLLFMQTLPELDNVELENVIYPSFYEAQYRCKDHLRRDMHRGSFKSKEEKETYKKWEKMEYQKRYDELLHLSKYSHPTRYEDAADTFEKWQEKERKRFKERKKENKHHDNDN